MIEKRDIMKMVKHVLRRSRGLSDPKIMHPARDWFAGLLAAFAVILIGAGSSFLLYFSYSDMESKGGEVVDTVVPYQAALVEEAISRYAQKKETYQDILLNFQNNNPGSGVGEMEVATSTTSEEEKGEAPEPESEAAPALELSI